MNPWIIVLKSMGITFGICVLLFFVCNYIAKKQEKKNERKSNSKS